jgi:(2S)-methylsuccinyl-CoA dehydrogenase
VVEKPSFTGHEWRAEQPGGGVMDARAIPTIGYRGMHSFEVSFENWRVPHADLIGMDDGLGRGFYLQMQAFANARLQTAARALGVMQAALEEAVTYAKERHVFGTPLAALRAQPREDRADGALIAACRVFAFDVARGLARGDEEAQLAASQVKQLAAGSASGSRARRSSCTAATATPRSTRCRGCSSTPGCCRSSRAPTRCSRCG